jgi:hypothetical protein
VRGARGPVADRVEAEAGHEAVLVVQRQHLAQQRIARIARRMRATKARGTRSGNCGAAASEMRAASASQAEQREQLARIAHGIAPLRCQPAVPARVQVSGLGAGIMSVRSSGAPQDPRSPTF